jgi:hypothetical protein
MAGKRDEAVRPPERLGELLDAATRGGRWDADLAVAIERSAAELSAEERAFVARFLEQAIAIVNREAAKIERRVDG